MKKRGVDRAYFESDLHDGGCGVMCGVAVE